MLKEELCQNGNKSIDFRAVRKMQTIVRGYCCVLEEQFHPLLAQNSIRNWGGRTNNTYLANTLELKSCILKHLPQSTGLGTGSVNFLTKVKPAYKFISHWGGTNSTTT